MQNTPVSSLEMLRPPLILTATSVRLNLHFSSAPSYLYSPSVSRPPAHDQIWIFNVKGYCFPQPDWCSRSQKWVRVCVHACVFYAWINKEPSKNIQAPITENAITHPVSWWLHRHWMAGLRCSPRQAYRSPQVLSTKTVTLTCLLANIVTA